MRSRILLVIGTLFVGRASGQALAPVDHPLQGLVDLLVEYLEVRYPDQDVHGEVLYISVQRQRIFHVQNGRLLDTYPVSTAQKGLGCELDSYCTPMGLHRIAEKIGEDIPPLGILRDRQYTGELADPDFAGIDKDWITSRVLWLDGLEPGVNQGGQVDSRDRYIYIHGTANERSVGTPASMGCIRMLNNDVIELYEHVGPGALVVVLDN